MSKKLKYDWALLTNGDEHVLVHGKDFTVDPANLQIIIAIHAKRHGLKNFWTKRVGNRLYVQFRK